MESNHSTTRWPVINERKSMIMLAKEPDGTIMIFVHGFGGSPLRTWENFHGYLPVNNVFKGADLLFYNYNSKTVQANSSALELHQFMGELVSGGNYFERYFRGKKEEKLFVRPEQFRYKRIIFVAHSLGAIICRKAMLFSHDKPDIWHRQAEMVLFAPAHSGARAVGPVKRLFSFIPFLEGILSYNIVTVDDVDLSLPTCSLHQLRRETAQLLAAHDGDFTVAKKVVWAKEDHVVTNEPFYDDPEPGQIQEVSHVTICKPYSAYNTPITALEFLFTN